MKANIKIGILLGVFLIVLNACTKEINKEEGYKKGEVTLAVDPSFYPLALALKQVFRSTYPEADIKLKKEVEDLVITNFINGDIPVIMVGRDLTSKEADFLYQRTKIKYKSAQVACDGVVFITSKKNEIEELSLDQLKKEIFVSENKFVFDGGNTSNFNKVKMVLGTSLSQNQKLKSFSTSKEVINFIEKNPSYIGVVGFGVLSDESDPEVKKWRAEIKMLPISTGEGQIIVPTLQNLRTNKYPFTRRVFLLNAENGFRIASSFLRFSTSQRGQLIVSREGLQPYFLYSRQINMTK